MTATTLEFTGWCCWLPSGQTVYLPDPMPADQMDLVCAERGYVLARRYSIVDGQRVIQW
jgi:hypothetical protein